jgi:hypothetical protein
MVVTPEMPDMKAKAKIHPSDIFKRMLEDKNTIEEYIKTGKANQLKERGIQLVQF